jgi:hypothetical protein
MHSGFLCCCLFCFILFCSVSSLLFSFVSSFPSLLLYAHICLSGFSFVFISWFWLQYWYLFVFSSSVYISLSLLLWKRLMVHYHIQCGLCSVRRPYINLEKGLYCNHLVCPSVHLSVRSHFRNRYLSFYRKKWFYIWYMALAFWLVPCLPFPGLPRDLEFFMFAVMKTFVTDISASTGRNDFIFDMWLWHGDLYRVSSFQVYRTSTSCLPCDLQMNKWGYS